MPTFRYKLPKRAAGIVFHVYQTKWIWRAMRGWLCKSFKDQSHFFWQTHSEFKNHLTVIGGEEQQCLDQSCSFQCCYLHTQILWLLSCFTAEQPKKLCKYMTNGKRKMQVLHCQHEFTNTSAHVNILVNRGHLNTRQKKKRVIWKSHPNYEVVRYSFCTVKKRILDKWADANSLNISLKSERGWADLTACCCPKKTVLLFLWTFPQKFAPSSSSLTVVRRLFSSVCISKKLFLFLAKLVFRWVTGLNHLKEGPENRERTSPLCRSRNGRKKEAGLGGKWGVTGWVSCWWKRLWEVPTILFFSEQK